MAKITKQQAQKLLRDVSEEHVFYCVDGRVARNLEDLQNALANMSDDTFSCHANPDKNDFANWVADVIGDEKLAGDIREAADHLQALEAVSQRGAFLMSKI